MKKINIVSGFIFASLASLLMSSCCEYEAPKTSTGSQKVTRVEVPDDMFGFSTGDDGNTYAVKTDDNSQTGEITKVYVSPNSNNTDGESGFIRMDNGKVSSVTIGDVTYTFNDNDGNVDVAVTSHGYTELFQSVGTSSNVWKTPNSNSLASRMAALFGTYKEMLALIKKVNGQIEPSSGLYPYVNGLQPAVDNRGKDTDVLTKEDILDGAIKSDVEKNNDPIDEDDMDRDDKDSSDNTDSAHAAIISGTGKLKVTLSWKFSADVDCYVVEPKYDGEKGIIYYAKSQNSFCGGQLDIDNRVGYYIDPETGVSNKNLAAVENIYYGDNLDEGEYIVKLNYFDGSASGPCTVTIYKDGKSIGTKTVTLTPNDKYDGESRVFVNIGTVKMPEGIFTSKDGRSTSMSKVAGKDRFRIPQKN